MTEEERGEHLDRIIDGVNDAMKAGVDKYTVIGLLSSIKDTLLALTVAPDLHRYLAESAAKKEDKAGGAW